MFLEGKVREEQLDCAKCKRCLWKLGAWLNRPKDKGTYFFIHTQLETSFKVNEEAWRPQVILDPKDYFTSQYLQGLYWKTCQTEHFREHRLSNQHHPANLPGSHAMVRPSHSTHPNSEPERGQAHSHRPSLLQHHGSIPQVQDPWAAQRRL